MTKPLRIGVAGLGTVGVGTLSIIEEHGKLLAARCGREFVVSAVSARDRRKNRGVDVSSARWFDDAVEMAADSEVDVVLEMVGGSEGVARQVVETAIANGKDVVTANKALLAHHGTQLARAAEEARVFLGYEAAVAGGIPVIKSLREGLGGNAINRVYGILNGTCNYILTAMRESGRDFDDVLFEAQDLGYAEADPSFDVDGVDAAHKLAILTSLAFGCEVDFDSVYIEGIREISSLDIAYAEELGYRIKLLGIAQHEEAGVLQRVHPCMVAKDTPIANVEGVFNAVVAEGDFVGRILSEGAGAGAGPTGSAVVADLLDIARRNTLPTFAVPASQLAPSKSAPIDLHVSSHYIRLMVVDRPGVIADVAAALRDEEISMEAMLQRGHAPGEAVPIVITTHATTQQHIASALKRIDAMESVLETPRMIRIESL